MVDFLIVGQGLAGTWLTHYLMAAGKRVAVVDDSRRLPTTASRVASGIMNPITGKRFVKTWQADTVLPFAHHAYQTLAQQLGSHFFSIKPIVWLLHQLRDLNHLSALSAEPSYANYIGEVSAAMFDNNLQPHLGYACINAGCVQMDVFLTAFRHYLQQQNALIDAPFCYNDLTLDNGAAVRWGEVGAHHLIFCEGSAAMGQNPYFSFLPYTPAKGEVLLIRLKDADFSQVILKNGVFILHYRDDCYWVGSNYAHQYHTELPTLETRQWIVQQIADTLRCSYDIVAHWAAVRPASHYRRPFVGRHPQHRQLAVLNGLGTKGVSLAPYYAAQLAEHLINDAPIDAAVRIDSYFGKA